MMSRVTLAILAAVVIAIGVAALAGASATVIAILAGAALILTVLILRFSVLPISTLARGVDMLRGQDFNSRLLKTGHDDTDSLVRMFNDMMAGLNTERMRVRETNRYLDLLVEASPMGIINLDIDGNIDLINPAAAKLLGVVPAEIKGLSRSAIPGVAGQRIATLSAGQSATIHLRTADPAAADDSILALSCYSFIDRGFPRLTIFIEPMTDLVRATERAAYNRIIRVMAHEINNSMGAVRSTLDLLSDTPEITADPDMVALVRSCSDRASSLTAFIDSYARVARLPKPSPAVTDIHALITNIFPALQALARGAELTLGGEGFMASVDAVQIEQVMVNVVKNAAESIRRCGRPDGQITITLRGADRTIEIADNGVGIPAEIAPDIFTPFFTTKSGAEASGIGLTLTADILRAHRAKFSLATSPADRLTRFTLRLPPI